MVVAASLPIRSPLLQPHLDRDVEKLVGVVSSSRTSSGYEDLQIVEELHRQFIILIRLWDGCGLLDPFSDFPSASSNVTPAQRGVAAAARC